MKLTSIYTYNLSYDDWNIVHSKLYYWVMMQLTDLLLMDVLFNHFQHKIYHSFYEYFLITYYPWTNSKSRSAVLFCLICFGYCCCCCNGSITKQTKINLEVCQWFHPTITFSPKVIYKNRWKYKSFIIQLISFHHFF